MLGKQWALSWFSSGCRVRLGCLHAAVREFIRYFLYWSVAQAAVMFVQVTDRKAGQHAVFALCPEECHMIGLKKSDYRQQERTCYHFGKKKLLSFRQEKVVTISARTI
jgi:hypothetical protein